MIARFSMICLVTTLLAACTPVGVLVTAGTTAGTYAMEERGLERATFDLGLKAKVVGKWAEAEVSYASDLTVIVYNTKAMVTGAVKSEEQRSEAIGLVWQTEGITEVFNEILIKTESNLQDFAHDTWITTKLFTATTFDSQILDLNYKTDVEGGTVYVIGLAQSKAELNRFIAHAKSISYVKKVITHVDIKPKKSMYRENYNKSETKS